MNKEKYDVIIAGAGPSGLAASLTLSAYGISHCIIDANEAAVPKPGDALPPTSKPLFKQLGILGLLESKKHIPYYGNKSIWGTNIAHQKEFIENKHGHGYLLDRLHFENQLRELVQEKQTPFYKKHQIKRITQNEDQLEISMFHNSTKPQLQASYIIDATGRKASICRHLGIVKEEMDQQMTCTFWHESAHKIERQIWIEATENGWWYLSPSSDNKVNVMFFTLKELIPKKSKMPAFLKKELYKTQEIRLIIKPTDKELSDHKIMPSGTSYLKKPYGKNWLAVGDAAFSYDPISSYGITSAIASGYYGAHAIASQLHNEKDAFLSYHYIITNGANSYVQKLTHQYAMEQRWPDSYYWKNRLVKQE
ncbi:flavin-dependent dehydrogenase [Nonlabens dokdonensis]|jgi:flavin-dependent dehydrogenase|uniref:Dehydrogenases (Flavoproteins)-like protein n=2 Tax=Nonlabens dokdonensis TaxID=328515 RepID=L7WDB5_NONDD|nr:NAD(P)/FAD-dependent oxidoreductase [Nonlabens dokdonensis]AGC78242.1 dehydrogenases (Flavoproteins)-like protein [Nonlabens dokdonensis DSW-6]PZX37869.1 flavin-dependent dehydrogenase [Nonlabens dokdonensis]